MALSPVDMDQVRAALNGLGESIVGCFAQMYVAAYGPDRKLREWQNARVEGFLCLVYEYATGKYFFMVFDRMSKRILYEFEMYQGIIYREAMANFHAYETSDGYVGFGFHSSTLAKQFLATVTEANNSSEQLMGGAFFNDDGSINIAQLPGQWKQLLSDAGFTMQELMDPAYAGMIVQVLQEVGFSTQAPPRGLKRSELVMMGYSPEQIASYEQYERELQMYEDGLRAEALGKSFSPPPNIESSGSSAYGGNGNSVSGGSAYSGNVKYYGNDQSAAYAGQVEPAPRSGGNSGISSDLVFPNPGTGNYESMFPNSGTASGGGSPTHRRKNSLTQQLRNSLSRLGGRSRSDSAPYNSRVVPPPPPQQQQPATPSPPTSRPSPTRTPPSSSEGQQIRPNKSPRQESPTQKGAQARGKASETKEGRPRQRPKNPDGSLARRKKDKYVQGTFGRPEKEYPGGSTLKRNKGNAAGKAPPKPPPLPGILADLKLGAANLKKTPGPNVARPTVRPNVAGPLGALQQQMRMLSSRPGGGGATNYPKPNLAQLRTSVLPDLGGVGSSKRLDLAAKLKTRLEERRLRIDNSDSEDEVISDSEWD